MLSLLRPGTPRIDRGVSPQRTIGAPIFTVPLHVTIWDRSTRVESARPGMGIGTTFVTASLVSAAYLLSGRFRALSARLSTFTAWRNDRKMSIR